MTRHDDFPDDEQWARMVRRVFGEAMPGDRDGAIPIVDRDAAPRATDPGATVPREIAFLERVCAAGRVPVTLVDTDAGWRRVIGGLEKSQDDRPSVQPVRGAAGMAPGTTVKKRFRAWPSRRLVPYSFPHVAGLGMALGAAILALSVGGILRVSRRPAAPSETAATSPVAEIHTSRGQRTTIRLADSTLVTLAPMSHLRLAQGYGARSREVFLEGEAAFTVVHDTNRPFAVHTAHAIARDLGTRFVVRAYAADPRTDVMVAEGLVAVDPVASAGDTLVLTRGELARLSADGRWTRIRGIPSDRYFGWTEGRLVFRDVSLREAITQLCRWYDVDIHLASEDIGARSLDASFRGESAAEILHVIATVLKLDLVQAGHTYTLRAKPARPM